MNRENTLGTHDGADLNALAERIATREDFAAFAGALRDHLQGQPSEWENPDLASFLDAIAAWVKDMDGYYLSRGEPVPATPSWKTFGRILLAARVYE